MEIQSKLVEAVLQVMAEVEGIEKSMTIGTGTNSYKGVPDQEVKKIVGAAMRKAGLVLLPIGVSATTKIDRWEENTQYGAKMKQSVFTEVTTRYKLMHTSGEFEILEGYGHGVDSQDKSAGKATTYALKYALLYSFLIPTGKIDDADNEHSDDKETPPPANDLPWLNEKDEVFPQVCQAIKDGKRTVAQIREKYKISKAVEAKLNEHLPK